MHEKIMSVAKHYKAILDCEQFIITGSVALSLMGVFRVEDPKDLDIILVNPNDKCLNISRRLQEENQVISRASHSGNEVKFSFVDREIEIDIFIEKEKVSTCACLSSGILINPMDRIVRAMKKMNRLKDWRKLLILSNSILSESELIHYLKSF